MPYQRELSKLMRSGIPRAMVQIHEQRRVAGHFHHVGVAFHAGHERRLAEGRAQIALAGVLRDGVFADENFRAVAVVFVILIRRGA